MATLAEVRNTAAGLLGKHRLGQAINSALKTRLEKSYDSVYDDLKDRRIVTWPKAAGATIPDKMAPHVAALMAFEATSEIGVSRDRMQRIREKEALAVPAIARISKPDYESIDEPTDF